MKEEITKQEEDKPEKLNERRMQKIVVQSQINP
jgi:hypothetical protein